MMSPEEPFYDVKGDHQELQSAKVFGCPTYVLDTIIQDEKIIPKWIYCSNMGKFFEHYDQHDFSVFLICNFRMNAVFVQFH